MIFWCSKQRELEKIRSKKFQIYCSEVVECVTTGNQSWKWSGKVQEIYKNFAVFKKEQKNSNEEHLSIIDDTWWLAHLSSSV